MADRHRRISRGAMNIGEEDDCPFSVEAASKEENEEMLSTANHHPAGHEDNHSGNLFSAILNRWLMSNTFYSSSLNSIRFK